MISLDDLKALAGRRNQGRAVGNGRDRRSARAFDGKTELEAAQTPNLIGWRPGDAGSGGSHRAGRHARSGPGTLASSATIRSSSASGGRPGGRRIDMHLTDSDLAARAISARWTPRASSQTVARDASRRKRALAVWIAGKIRIPGVDVIVRRCASTGSSFSSAETVLRKGCRRPTARGRQTPLPVAPRLHARNMLPRSRTSSSRRPRKCWPRAPGEHGAPPRVLQVSQNLELTEIYGVRAGVIAVYPMYRGLPAGRDGGGQGGDTVADEFGALENHFGQFDFSSCTSENRQLRRGRELRAKVHVIEETTGASAPVGPQTRCGHGHRRSLDTGCFKAHSWHPVPVLLWSKWCRPDGAKGFSERECRCGGLGHVRSPSSCR